MVDFGLGINIGSRSTFNKIDQVIKVACIQFVRIQSIELIKKRSESERFILQRILNHRVYWLSVAIERWAVLVNPFYQAMVN